MCALLKKPKMPIEVNRASAITAGTRYSFNNQLARCQYLRNHTVVVILPTSSMPPIIITGITAPAKIAVKPIILYQAATELSESATSSVRLENDKKLRRI